MKRNRYCIACGKETDLTWPAPKAAGAEPVACSKGCVAYSFLHVAESAGSWSEAYCCWCGAAADLCKCADQGRFVVSTRQQITDAAQRLIVDRFAEGATCKGSILIGLDDGSTLIYDLENGGPDIIPTDAFKKPEMPW